MRQFVDTAVKLVLIGAGLTLLLSFLDRLMPGAFS